MISITFLEKNNSSRFLKNSFLFIKKKTFFSLILSLSIFISANGQNLFPAAYKITSDTAAFLILPDSNWQAMADVKGNLTLEQVINSKLFKDTNQKINYKNKVYWLRYQIINSMQEATKISLPEVASKVDLYAKINDGIWQHSVTGTGVPWSHRDGLKRVLSFTITIPQGDTLIVYKRVYWNYVAAQPHSMKIDFSFTDKLIQHDYINDNSNDMTAIQDAFLLGMFILSIIINFYFFLVVREKEFLYFSLFLLVFSVEALCSLNDAFLRDSPQLVLYLYVFSNSLTGFFLIQFARYFLKTFRRFPRWDKYLVLFSFTDIAIILFSSFASAVFHINLANLSHVSENSIKLIFGISMLATLFLFIRDKERNNRLMIIALTPLMLLQVAAYGLAIIYGLYYPRFGSPDISGYQSGFNKAAFFILIVSYLWMMIFFSWVLFQRFSDLRKELDQQTSLDHLKSRFFANISHEFRTPLTLIIGPIEDLLHDKNAQKFREPLQYIHRNSKRLLQLINQLLDLSKLDAGNYRVDTTRDDIIPFVKQIVHSFSSMAQRKNILLETEVDPRLKNNLRNDVLNFYFDEDIFEKILYNLLSNAFKFTPEGGSIIVSICLSEKNLLELKVEDTGAGIPSEKIPFIFDRFYQADDSHKRQYGGSGIGLALVKELVELHHGNITVESNTKNGTTFSCYFPFNKEILSKTGLSKIAANQNTPLAIEEIENSAHEDNPNRSAQSKVLVVEDQQDVRRYICEKLAETYLITEAKNGREGFEIAKQQIPDLIISDVMMPEMDGFELCHLLKTNDLTSHIPVILLTARAEDADKLTGLENRADAYLIKPFNSKELLLRAHNLIEIRNKLRKKFSDQLFVKPSEITVTSQDSSFMQRLLDTVEKHLNDEHFSVEQLGYEFGMSPSQINRKLKAIINQSALQFIRSIRMQRSLELLKNKTANISEIAYQVGFNDPGYFARVFKVHYGYPPSEVKSE
ncbi:MAG TPA: ATP-binding protein [Hanamia sp.]|nr:ATP-binding protein [Hanamia sp.]